MKMNSKLIGLSIISALLLSACSTDTKEVVTLVEAESKDVTVERGPVIGAVVTDAVGQVANFTGTGAKYTFENIPRYPITATGGYIDTNNNGVVDLDEKKLDKVLVSNSGDVVTVLTTLSADFSEKLSNLGVDIDSLKDKTPLESNYTYALSNVLYEVAMTSGKSIADLGDAELTQVIDLMNDSGYVNKSVVDMTDTDKETVITSYLDSKASVTVEVLQTEETDMLNAVGATAIENVEELKQDIINSFGDDYLEGYDISLTNTISVENMIVELTTIKESALASNVHESEEFIAGINTFFTSIISNLNSNKSGIESGADFDFNSEAESFTTSTGVETIAKNQILNDINTEFKLYKFTPMALYFESVVTELNNAVSSDNNLTELLESAEANITNLSDQIDLLTETQAGLETQLSDSELAKSELQTQIDTANIEISTLTTDLETVNANITNLETELTTANETVTGLETQLETLSADQAEAIAAVQAELDIATAAQADLQTQVDTAIADKALVEASLAAANAEISALTADLETATTSISTLTADLETVNASLTAANIANATLQNDLDIAIADKTAIEADLVIANSSIADLEAQIATLNSDQTDALAALQSDLDIVNADKIALESDLTTATNTIAALESEISTLTADLATIQSDLDAANIANADLQAQLDAAGTSEALIIVANAIKANVSAYDLTVDRTELNTDFDKVYATYAWIVDTLYVDGTAIDLNALQSVLQNLMTNTTDKNKLYLRESFIDQTVLDLATYGVVIDPSFIDTYYSSIASQLTESENISYIKDGINIAIATIDSSVTDYLEVSALREYEYRLINLLETKYTTLELVEVTDLTADLLSNISIASQIILFADYFPVIKARFDSKLVGTFPNLYSLNYSTLRANIETLKNNYFSTNFLADHEELAVEKFILRFEELFIEDMKGITITTAPQEAIYFDLINVMDTNKMSSLQSDFTVPFQNLLADNYITRLNVDIVDIKRLLNDLKELSLMEEMGGEYMSFVGTKYSNADFSAMAIVMNGIESDLSRLGATHEVVTYDSGTSFSFIPTSYSSVNDIFDIAKGETSEVDVLGRGCYVESAKSQKYTDIILYIPATFSNFQSQVISARNSANARMSTFNDLLIADDPNSKGCS